MGILTLASQAVQQDPVHPQHSVSGVILWQRAEAKNMYFRALENL